MVGVSRLWKTSKKGLLWLNMSVRSSPTKKQRNVVKNTVCFTIIMQIILLWSLDISSEKKSFRFWMVWKFFLIRSELISVWAHTITAHFLENKVFKESKQLKHSSCIAKSLSFSILKGFFLSNFQMRKVEPIYSIWISIKDRTTPTQWTQPISATWRIL